MKDSMFRLLFLLVLILEIQAVRPPTIEDGDITLATSPRGIHQMQNSSLAELSDRIFRDALDSNESADSNISADDDKTFERPKDPKNATAPTTIEFGITFRQFFSMTIPQSYYQADIVLMTTWTDESAKNLVPNGQTTATFGADDMTKNLWLPGNMLANRDINGVEWISQAALIDKGTGKVTQIQRAVAKLKNKFDLSKYPKDSQDLIVLVSSSKYMYEDVVYKEASSDDAIASKVLPTAFDGKDMSLVKVAPDSFLETSGPLHKSRARLTVTCVRSSAKFIQSVLLPSCFLAMASYGVFWLPLMAPFIMPRVGTGAVVYIAFMQVSTKYDNLITGAGASWGDDVLGVFSTCIFMVLTVNVFLEFVSHQLKATERAQQMNSDMKKIYPLTILVAATEVLLIGPYVPCLGSLTVIAIIGGYILWCCSVLAKDGTLKVWAPADFFTIHGPGEEPAKAETPEAEPAKAETPQPEPAKN